MGYNPSLLDTRATISLLRGNAQGAADDLARAMETQAFPQGYFHRAQVELRLGNRDAAKTSLAQGAAMRLRIEDLHPLERPAYRQLQAELR